MFRLILTGGAPPEPVPKQAWPMANRGAERDVAARIDKAVAVGVDHLVFAGSDGLLDANVIAWLERARDARVQRIEVWTDGRVLTRKGAAERLEEAGLTHVGVVLFGAEEAAHDFVAGSPGRFKAALRGLRIARKAGLRTAVVAPILRPTFRDLPVLVQRSLALGVGRFEFVAVRGPDRPVHGLVPHVAMAAPYVERAMRVALGHRRAAHSWWTPACLLGSMQRRARNIGADAPGIASYFAQERVQPCQACAISPQCGGPLTDYVAQHGADGLVALADPPTQ